MLLMDSLLVQEPFSGSGQISLSATGPFLRGSMAAMGIILDLILEIPVNLASTMKSSFCWGYWAGTLMGCECCVRIRYRPTAKRRRVIRFS